MKSLRERPRSASVPIVDARDSDSVLADTTATTRGPAVESGRPALGWWAAGSAWARSHPTVLDATMVVLIDTWAVVSLTRQGAASWWEVALSQLLVLPLVLRRRAPWPLFGFLCVIAAVQFAAEVHFVADAALLIALYTVAAHESRRRAVAAAAVLEIGVVLASVRFAPTGSGVIASIVFLSGLVAAAVFSGVTLQTRRDLLASLLDRARQLERERDQQIRLAATAERTRIAREMHDVIAHSLSVIITLADGAALANSTAPAEATEAMLQVAVTGRTSMTEMRRLLGVLRDSDTAPDLGPQPGMDRLDALIADMRAAGLPAQLSVTGAPRPVPPTTASVVYRIVQESLTNALKHADHPTQVRVGVHWHAEKISLTISDDGGPGSAADTPGSLTTGHGMTGMRERAALFGATLTAGPQAPQGWQVRTTLPLEPLPTTLPPVSGT